ncbi:hypothetical protein ACFFVB_03380, partial [Formosa undariae]
MKKILLLLILFTAHVTYSQVGIGTDMPNSSTQLEIVSSNKGVLIPQVPLTSLTDQTTISAGNIESLLVYNTNTSTGISPGYYYWYQDRWVKFLGKQDLPDNIVYWDVVNNQYSYIDENGDVQIITNSNVETLTFLSLNEDGKSLEYKDENGDVTALDMTNLVKNLETITTIVDNGDGTITYFNENNDQIVIDLASGPAGLDGVGITSTVDNGNGTFTILYSDGSTFTTSDFTGEQGVAGADGIGIGSTTDNGDGTFTIVYTDGSTFTTVNLAGSDGADGVGVTGTTDNGDGTFTITYSDGTSFTTPDFTGAQGVAGTDGSSAFEIAVSGGYTGTESDWLASLNGADGADGSNGVDGVDGTDGSSAFEIAVAGGYTGTEAAWLASLNGADGA